MDKYFGFSGMKRFDLNPSSSSGSGSAAISSRASSEFVHLESFANLKLAAEKLVKELTSPTDLYFASCCLQSYCLQSCKLKKLIDDFGLLEEKFQNARNDHAELKVKHKEDEVLLKGLVIKFSSTKTLCDQLTNTLQDLASQVQDEIFVNEQTSAKADLEFVNCKLKKLIGDIRVLEEKSQHALNEKAKLKVKLKEDDMLWNVIEFKFSSTKILCDQLIYTLQDLASQVQDDERNKLLLELNEKILPNALNENAKLKVKLKEDKE